MFMEEIMGGFWWLKSGYGEELSDQRINIYGEAEPLGSQRN